MNARVSLILAIIVLVVASGFSLPARAADTLAVPIDPPGEVVIKLNASVGAGPASPAVQQLFHGAGIERVIASPGTPDLVLARLSPGVHSRDAIAFLEQSLLIRYAEPNAPMQLANHTVSFLDTGNAATNTAGGWALNQIGAERAWSYTTGSGVTVAVLDTGVSLGHQSLAGRVLSGWDFVHDLPHAGDDNGHGTYIASLIAGRAFSGIDSVAPGAMILPVKILDQNGVGSTGAFALGISYAVEQGANVINISAGGVMNSQALREAIAEAEQAGAIVIAAAGNGGEGAVQYPAAYPETIGVGAFDQHGNILPTSSSGPHVAVVAPGADIRGAWIGNSLRTASGTSASTALAAGVAALTISALPDASPLETRQLITAAAIPVGERMIDPAAGYGRLDASRVTIIASYGETGASGWATIDPATRIVLAGGSGFHSNEPVLVWVRDAAQHLHVKHTSIAGPDGSAWVELQPEWRYAPGQAHIHLVGLESLVHRFATLTIRAAPIHPAFAPISPFMDSDSQRYFPETGHSLSFGFKHYWEINGGLARFGFPISEEFSEMNPDSGKIHTVQYFERARFEYHPDFAGTPFEVSLGRLGDQLGDGPFPRANPESLDLASVSFFPETGYTVPARFLDHWSANGGLKSFGFPLSEPFSYQGRVVQYFERARFEHHPANPEGHRVLLGRLGYDLARQNGYLGEPTH